MIRVAVTTAHDASERVAAVFRTYGLSPVVLPCIQPFSGEEEVLLRLRRAASSAHWVLITSARAVVATWPQGGMPAVPVAAVGEASARAVHRAGGRVALWGGSGVEDVLALMSPDLDGRQVVFPHARDADRGTVDRLERLGARVVAGVAYGVVPIAPGPDPVDAVAFGSPSAVEGWVSGRTLDGLSVGAVGPTTAAALRAHGCPPDVVADRPEFGRLAAAMAQRAGERIPS